ncbi:MAG: hypothetical protein M1812_007309 [Candelaria pacifica]|nr:MAG: hypothetical protein M1812_007309 [Candelaria pacifica]
MPHHHHLLSPLIHRRSNAADPHLNLRNATPDPEPEAFAAPDANADPGAATIVSVVYVTAAKTFSGPVAGYSTIDPNANTNSIVQPTPSSFFSSSAQKATLPTSSEARVTPSKTTSQTPPVQSTSSSTPIIVQSSSSTTSQVVPASTLQSTTDAVASTIQTSDSSSAALAAVSSTTDGSSSPSSVAAASTSINSVSSSASSTTASQASSTSAVAAASSPSSSSDPSGGLSGGAKAGLALGILLGAVALLGLLLFCYRRKKKHGQTHGKLDDEKSPFGDDGATFAAGRAPSTRTARTASTAPRLSLRPVTQFLPNLGGNRKSNSNQLAMASAPSGMTAAAGMNRNLTPSPQPHQRSHWERPADHGQPRANDPANPFGNHAEDANQAQLTGATEPAAPVNPFGNDAQRSDIPTSGPSSASQAPHVLDPPASGPSGTTHGGHGGDIAAAAGVGLAAGAAAGTASRRHDESQPLEMAKNANASQDRSASPSPYARTGQPSPDGTEYSMSSIPGTPVKPQLQAAATPGAPAPNVHRVQLDFKPSMDDELELRAGQLVRMLHEYDDGWALCIRLDRSQQGVAPRTCLSTRPVKPRQGGPPQGQPRGPPPGMRAPPQGPSFSHANGAIRPLSPAGGRGSPDPYGHGSRAMSPAGGRNAPVPFGQPSRPMSPGAGPYAQPPRPLSPGGRARQPQPHFGGKPRSVSPGPYGGGQQRPTPPVSRRRSNSASQVMARRASPPGPSPMNPNAAAIQRSPPVSRSNSQEPLQQMAVPMRKPVPGQAL